MGKKSISWLSSFILPFQVSFCGKFCHTAMETSFVLKHVCAFLLYSRTSVQSALSAVSSLVKGNPPLQRANITGYRINTPSRLSRPKMRPVCLSLRSAQHHVMKLFQIRGSMALLLVHHDTPMYRHLVLGAEPTVENGSALLALWLLARVSPEKETRSSHCGLSSETTRIEILVQEIFCLDPCSVSIFEKFGLVFLIWLTRYSSYSNSCRQFGSHSFLWSNN